MKIDCNPASYGSKGQNWHEKFVAYMAGIVTHENYAGMPDAIKPDGKIQWEAPSNRGAGVFQDTHHKRRDWWRRKAQSIGIDPESDQWISRTAKTIHPTGEKPCKRCGTVLKIAYAYFGCPLSKRATKLFGAGYAPQPLEEITAFVRRVYNGLGPPALTKLPELLRTTTVTPPALGNNLEAWLSWIESVYIPQESSLLSPGAMSNAPDRFDGFHSFNRCCRGQADTGRHETNLRSYITDRRVFEYWSEGDWIAADRMMGVIRAKFSNHPTADGGPGPATADHIGPLSLGFTHRPEFRLLSKPANSAKNNRMTLWDVNYLQVRETEGEQVVSWHARRIWQLLKSRAVTEETCLRISKIMRDNQRALLMLLGRMFQDSQFAFLASLLELERADFSVEFEGLYVAAGVVRYRSAIHTPRKTKYAVEQKARRLRIGFTALQAYLQKSNRHRFESVSPEIEARYNAALLALVPTAKSMCDLNEGLYKALFQLEPDLVDSSMRTLAGAVPALGSNGSFMQARGHLEHLMEVVAADLAAKWDDDRYVRAEFAFDDDLPELPQEDVTNDSKIG